MFAVGANRMKKGLPFGTFNDIHIDSIKAGSIVGRQAMKTIGQQELPGYVINVYWWKYCAVSDLV